MFETENVKFTIKGKEYSIKPLTGVHMPKFFQFLSKLSPAANSTFDLQDTAKSLELLDPIAMGLLHELSLASLLASYPDKKAEDLDSFVSQNLLRFIAPLMKANMPSEADDGPKSG